MTWKRRSSAVRGTRDTAIAAIYSPSMPTGVQPANGPFEAGNCGNGTCIHLHDLIERTKQLRADVRTAREELEAQYGTGNSQA